MYIWRNTVWLFLRSHGGLFESGGLLLSLHSKESYSVNTGSNQGKTVPSIYIRGKKKRSFLISFTTVHIKSWPQTETDPYFRAPCGPYNPKWTVSVTVITHIAQDQQLDHGLHMTSSYPNIRYPLNLRCMLSSTISNCFIEDHLVHKNNLIYFTLRSLPMSLSRCLSGCLLFVLMNDFWDEVLLWRGHRGLQNHITVNDNKKNNLC